MARNLHKHGLLVGVWNRTTQKSTAFAEATGCEAFADLGRMAERCDTIVLCVSRDEDALAVVEALAEAVRPETIVIDCSTVSAKTARSQAALLARHSAKFLDCPISGGTEGARDGKLAIMAGGEPAVLEAAMPILKAMGEHIVHMGPVGAGQATKAVNQVAMAGLNQAVTEALAFAESQDLPLDRVIDVLGGGAAASWFLAHRGPTMTHGEYPLGFKVSLHQKDLEICRQMASERSVRLPLVEMTLLHYRRLIEAGHSDEDISALHRLKRSLFEGKPD